MEEATRPPLALRTKPLRTPFNRQPEQGKRNSGRRDGRIIRSGARRTPAPAMEEINGETDFNIRFQLKEEY